MDLFSKSALAETSIMNISTEVIPTCVVSLEAGDLVLEYSPEASKYGRKDLTVLCSKGIAYTLQLQNTWMAKLTSDEGYHLNYAKILIKNDGYTSGNYTATEEEESFRVDAVILSKQYVKPGIYSENVTIDLIY